MSTTELVSLVRASPFSRPFLEHGKDLLVYAVRARTDFRLDTTANRHELFCPITLMYFEDPVCFADGFTYERAAIEKHLSRFNTSPKTGATHFTKDVLPNHNIRILVDEHKQGNAHETEDQRDALLARLLAPRQLVMVQLSVDASALVRIRLEGRAM